MKKTYKLTGLYNFLGSEFKNLGIENSDLDWIICEVLHIKRGEIINVQEISKSDFDKIFKIAKKRIKGKPIDRIFKKKEFYGREFKLSRFVLSPRLDTEILCETVLQNAGENQSVLEIGVGSGAICITLKKEKESLKVTGTDISLFALLYAKKNSKLLNADVTLIQSYLFDELQGEKFDLIVSNPPYIPTKDLLGLDKEVKNYDPRLALDGGADGLFFYREIIMLAPNYLKRGGKIFFEVGINQATDVAKMLEKSFCDIQVVKDYSGIDRVVWAKKKEEE